MAPWSAELGSQDYSMLRFFLPCHLAMLAGWVDKRNNSVTPYSIDVQEPDSNIFLDKLKGWVDFICEGPFRLTYHIDYSAFSKNSETVCVSSLHGGLGMIFLLASNWFFRWLLIEFWTWVWKFVLALGFGSCELGGWIQVVSWAIESKLSGT